MWMSNRPAAPQSNIWKFLQKLHKYSLAQCSRDWAFNSLTTDGRAWQCFDGFEPSAIISGAADAIDAIFAIAHNFLHPLDSMICLCPLLPLTPDGRNISPRNIAIQFWTFLVCSMVCWASWFATFSDPESYFHLPNANCRFPSRLPTNIILSKSKCMRGNSKNFPRWDHPENWLFSTQPTSGSPARPFPGAAEYSPPRVRTVGSVGMLVFPLQVSFSCHLYCQPGSQAAAAMWTLLTAWMPLRWESFQDTNIEIHK